MAYQTVDWLVFIECLSQSEASNFFSSLVEFFTHISTTRSDVRME